MATKSAPDTLGSSLNLLGLCMILLTSIHLTNTSGMSFIDEFTSILSLLLTSTAILSFIAMRNDNLVLEKYADRLFLASILGIFGVISYITIVFWESGKIPLE
jgi:formate hydrogenlyase subunit 4